MDCDLKQLTFERFKLEDSVYPPFLHMPAHRDRFSRISIILDGELQEVHDTHNIKAIKGSLVIKPKHCLHENTFGNRPVRALSISFYDESLFESFFNHWQWIRHSKANVSAARLWCEIKKIRNEEKLMKCLNDFISTVATLTQESSKKSVPWLAELKKLLETDLTDAEDINQIAEKFFFHRVHLSRAFKKHFCTSPVEYRKYAKVSAAFSDLLLTSKSLAAIAFDAGFSDQSHMTREFMRYIGYTPAKFRQLVKAS